MTLFGKLKIVKRLLSQAWVPFVVAVAYALWDHYSMSQGSRTIAGFVKSLGIAFFLVMWFFGQWFRVSKQVSDEERMSSLHADFAAIREWILQNTPQTVQRTTPQPIADDVANTLYEEALSAMNAGLYRSALLTASVALEHSIRRFAEAYGINVIGSRSAGQLLRGIERIVNPSIFQELVALWRVRTVIVHTPEEEFVDPEKTQQLLDGFGWAIRFLCEPDSPPLELAR
jgi:hypothetical protein